MLLRFGDHGYRVTALQKDLTRAGFPVSIDGWFGAGTERAVRVAQREHGLVIDGIAGPKTRAALQGRPLAKSLKQADLDAAARHLDVDLAAIMAVNEIESRGRGFVGRGDPAILFERHVMRRRLRLHGIEPEPIARRHPDLVNRAPGGYIGGIREHRRLERAREIHAPSAIESASWGLYQIMGYHWERLGYASAGVFEMAMRESEHHQLEAFVRFIEADEDLLRALRLGHWAAFAKGYNGRDFAKYDYDTRLARAYARHAEALYPERAA